MRLHETKERQEQAADARIALADRRAFEAALEEQAKRHQQQSLPLSVALIDVDFFQRYSVAGEEASAHDCLESIAAAIVDTLRGGHVVGRIGSDQFAILLAQTDEQQAVCIAEEIHFQANALVIPHPRSPISRYVTVSVGVATGVADLGRTALALLDDAAAALEVAKNTGRNRVVHVASIQGAMA